MRLCPRDPRSLRVVRILLDTHCWLRMKIDPDRFSAEARQIIEDPGRRGCLNLAGVRVPL
jgi:PIN domain nuclease of toxin-antitoxin system